MANLNQNMDDNFMRELAADTGIADPNEMTREAYILWNWAVKESLKGRVLLSANSEGKEVERLDMASLNRIRPPASQVKPG